MGNPFAPDALFPLVGLKRLSKDEAQALAATRRKSNSSTLKAVALVVGLLLTLQFGLSFFDAKIRPGSGLQLGYWSLFLGGIIVSAGFFLYWNLNPLGRGHLLFVRSLLILGAGLTVCDLQLSGDFSTYTLVLMGTSLLYSARLPWYLLDYSLAWGLVLLGLIWAPPLVVGVNPAAATGVVTVVSMVAGIILEARRISTERLTLELERKNQELRETAVRDALTGLHNRRFLFEWMEKQIPLAQRKAVPLTVALLDLDHFKQVNDTAGHEIGDEVLRHTARWLEAALRKSDVVARYGGEEFVVALPDTGLDRALPVLQRCLQSFRDQRVPGWDHPVTFSAGMSELGPGDSDKEVFQRCDELLYRAKKAGRNQIFSG